VIRIPEFARKLWFTLAVLVVYRIGSYIPVIGINTKMLADYMGQQKALGGLLKYLDLFSGGALQNCTLFALGIMPYITASLMMQLLSVTIPQLEQLSKEGEYGRKVINQYTRYLALALSIGYSLGYAAVLERGGLVLTPGFAFKALFVLSLVAGALFVMWLGDQLSLRGIGNGSSMIVFAGIVSHLPSDVIKTIYFVREGNMSPVIALGIALLFLVLISVVVFLEKGERKVPVHYARRIIGNRIYGGQSSYIPFKINSVGVMPVIFASSVLQVPTFVLTTLAARFHSLDFIAKAAGVGGAFYNISQFGLIVFFTFFYASIFFNPVELADNLKKGGGFIPGYRPGKQTADYFDYLLFRIGLVGAIYLASLALVPNVLYALVTMPFYFGGTSLLIMVGVALEIASQAESYLVENKYRGFTRTGMPRRKA
jgi:preprotein translocase subunit SecY